VGIGSYAFYSCANLISASLGSSLTNVGSYAFDNCPKLAILTLGCPTINNWFSGCPLTTVTILDTVTNIGNQAFYNFGSLSNVNFGNGIIAIGGQAFANCGLTNLIIPNSVVSVGGSAFQGCFNLKSVSIPNSLTYIAGDMFAFCSKLTSITIPSSVTNIYVNAFVGCNLLSSFYFAGNAPVCDPTALPGPTGNGPFVYYLPGTTGWSSRYGGPPSLPTVLWNPQAQHDASFGVQNNQFGFNITGSSNLVIVVQTCSNLTSPVWLPISTNTLNTYVGTNGTSYFSDPQWTNYPNRYYRLRSP